MTIHGGPLSYSSKTANENPVGIVPDGCILVIITPPQAVVFSSPTEDTETFRFFNKKIGLKPYLLGHHKTVMEPVNIFHHGLRKEIFQKMKKKKKRKKEGKKMVLAMMIVVVTIVVVTIVVARMMVQNHTILI